MRDPVTRFAESRLQCSLVGQFRRLLPYRYRLFSVPNGGYDLPKATAARLKAEGLLAGVSDLILARNDGWSGYIEVKVEGKPLSIDQIDWNTWCNEGGAEYAVVHSPEEMEAILRAWNVPLRGRVSA